MLLQKQKYNHDPDNGVFGDCYRTCLACLLGMERDSVPHHVATMCPNEWATQVQPKYDDWLSGMGLQELAIPVGGDPEMEQVLEFHKTRSPVSVPAMLTGKSRTGCNHVVIVNDGAIVHDPSREDAGIVGPADDGFYWITWLIPAGLVPPIGE